MNEDREKALALALLGSDAKEVRFPSVTWDRKPAKKKKKAKS